jgi:hypothetical protein
VKSFALLPFCLYMMLLPLIPCADTNNHKKEKMEVASAGDEGGGEHEDDCSPSCCCNCCPASTYTITEIETDGFLNVLSTTLLPFQGFNYPDALTPIWQPPRRA